MAYQRHYWKDYDETKTEIQNIEAGAVVTTEKLNEIENGIVVNYSELDIKKSDKTYVDSMLTSIAQGGPRELFYSLAALKAKYPTGNIGTYLVFDSKTTDGAHSYMWDKSTSSWKDLGIYQGVALADGSVSTQKMDSGILKTYGADNLIFRWGTMNANDGSLVSVSNTALTFNRAISYPYEFRKGTKFQLQNIASYRAWLNIFYKNGTWYRSVPLNTSNNWVLEEDCIIYIVVAMIDERTFTTQTMKTIQSNLYITSLKSDYDSKFPNTARSIKSDSIDWYYLTVNGDTGVSQYSNTRLTSDYIFVPKGTVIRSENPALGQWAVHTYNLDKTVRTASGKLFGNSYLDVLVEEDSYIRLTIANPTNTTIDAGGTIAKSLVTIIIPYAVANRNIKEQKESITPDITVPIDIIDFVFGSGDINTGEMIDGGNTRIRSVKKIFLKKGSKFTIDSDQQFAVYFYDVASEQYKRDYSISFLAGRTTYFAPDDGYYALVLANAGNAVIDDIATLASQIKLTTSNDIFLELIKEEQSLSTNPDIKEINLPFEFGSSITFVGDKLWKFNPSEDDNSTQVQASRFSIDFDAGKVTLDKSLKINWGHVNTLNYCDENDSLVFSNGNIGDTNARSKKFYVLEKFTTKSTQSSIDISECIEFDVSTLGIENSKGLSVALQPCWGENNDYRYNIIYLLWNDGNKKMISKILLGQGSNNLGTGILIGGKSKSEFNGTMKLLKTYQGHAYTDHECTQDATWAYGFLFEGIGHDGFWYDKIKLNEADSTFSKTSFQERFFASDGNLYNTVTNGITVKNGFLFSTVYHRANIDSTVDYVKLVSRKLV